MREILRAVGVEEAVASAQGLVVVDMLVSLLDKEAEAAHALLEDLEVTMLREAEELERDSARSTRGIPSGLRSRRSKIRD
jgi:hypothetical protein